MDPEELRSFGLGQLLTCDAGVARVVPKVPPKRGNRVGDDAQAWGGPHSEVELAGIAALQNNNAGWLHRAQQRIQVPCEVIGKRIYIHLDDFPHGRFTLQTEPASRHRLIHSQLNRNASPTIRLEQIC